MATEGEKVIARLKDVIAAKGSSANVVPRRGHGHRRAAQARGLGPRQSRADPEVRGTYLFAPTEQPPAPTRQDPADDESLFRQGPAHGLGTVTFADGGRPSSRSPACPTSHGCGSRSADRPPVRLHNRVSTSEASSAAACAAGGTPTGADRRVGHSSWVASLQLAEARSAPRGCLSPASGRRSAGRTGTRSARPGRSTRDQRRRVQVARAAQPTEVEHRQSGEDDQPPDRLDRRATRDAHDDQDSSEHDQRQERAEAEPCQAGEVPVVA